MEAHTYRTTEPRRARARDDKILAQYFALGLGVLLTIVGLAGFIVNSDFSTGDSITSDQLIIFDVNGWHNVAHLLTGLLGLYMGTRAGMARAYAGVIGIAYLLLLIIGLLDSTILGVIPVNDPDMALHGAIAIAGIAVAMAPDLSDTERRAEGN
ncbi:MAG TPA: DUF4383 domain-containing protein [Solirubrobacterales bacterium]|jgi:hypothetical protein|nr:DUF4383 domain-containing protein [Solirubrobacterales bacterium]